MLRVITNSDGAFSIVHDTLGAILSVESNGVIKVSSDAVLSLATLTQANVTLSAVTGVDGVGSNAASKADVDSRLSTIATALNNILTALRV